MQELTLEKMGPREVGRETLILGHCARSGPWPGTGLEDGGVDGCTRFASAPAKAQSICHFGLFPLYSMLGGSIVNCKDSQCALLWHETQIPFPSSQAICLPVESFVLSPNLAL